MNWFHQFILIFAHSFFGFLCISMSTPVGAADTVRAGQVIFSVGQVHTVGAGRQTTTLKKGQDVYVGQTLTTGSNGHVHLKMVDDAFLSVRPNSVLKIEVYDYDPKQVSQSRIKYTLEKGTARSITGRAGEANKSGFRLNTPVAAIAIRGTDFVVHTDSQLTRVSVSFGGVTVAPFSSDCLRESFGPCHAGLVDLIAKNGKVNAYLEIQNLQRTPVLVPVENGLDTNLPNRVSPPHPEEIRNINGTSGSRSLVPNSSETQAEKMAQTLTDSPPVVAAPSPKIFWGRWAAYLGGDQDRDLALTMISQTGRVLAVVNPGFAMARESGSISFPDAGHFLFKLADSEAYIQRGLQLSPASLSAANLSMDFQSRQFQTQLSVQSAQLSSPVHLSASGSLRSDGLFFSQSGNAEISGTLSRDSSQAGYIFRSVIDSSKNILGATRWVRQ